MILNKYDVIIKSDIHLRLQITTHNDVANASAIIQRENTSDVCISKTADISETIFDNTVTNILTLLV